MARPPPKIREQHTDVISASNASLHLRFNKRVCDRPIIVEHLHELIYEHLYELIYMSTHSMSSFAYNKFYNSLIKNG